MLKLTIHVQDESDGEYSGEAKAVFIVPVGSSVAHLGQIIGRACNAVKPYLVGSRGREMTFRDGFEEECLHLDFFGFHDK